MYEYNFKIKMAAKYRCIKIDLRFRRRRQHRQIQRYFISETIIMAAFRNNVNMQIFFTEFYYICVINIQ